MSESGLESWKQKPSQIRFSIQRNVFDFQDLTVAADYKIPPKKYFRVLIEILKNLSCKKCVFDTVPILKWLPKYQWKTDLVCDVTAGFTVAIMHIPQGMAYAILAKVDPIVGVYMGLFPVFAYALFGTSRHISMGTVAVMSLMCAQVVEKYFDEQRRRDVEEFTAMDFVTALCLDVGLIQVSFQVPIKRFEVNFKVLMYVFRMGIITTLLSESLVNAYTCASAVWILASQVPSFFDVKLPKRNGFGKMIIVFYDSAVAFPNSNWVTFSMTVIVFAVLITYLEILKVTVSSRQLKLFKPPSATLSQKNQNSISDRVGLRDLGTVISYSYRFHELYDVSVIGHVPTGWPRYKFPPMVLLPRLALDGLAVAIVAYAITISMSFIIASKKRYEIRPNQELLAMGIGNLLGCGFHCMPSAGSIPRSAIQEAVGGATQITSLVCCVLLLNVIIESQGALLLRTIDYNLGLQCVLACIITVHLKSVLLQIVSLKKYWIISKWDFLIWTATFVATVLVDLTVGLIFGVCVSLLTVFLRTQLPYTSIVAQLPQTGLYLNVERYAKVASYSCQRFLQPLWFQVTETVGLKIFSFSGALSFLTKDAFKSSLIKKIGINPMGRVAETDETLDVRCVVLDLSGVAYADPSGTTMLIELVSNFRRKEFFCLFPDAQVFGFTPSKCEMYGARVNNLMMFPTVHDAVLFAETNVLENGMEDDHLETRATLRVQRPVYQTEELNEVTTYEYPHTNGHGLRVLRKFAPIVGIYMAFFPVLIYVIFGTSRHVSMGTFAVVCLMTGKTVSHYAVEDDAVNSTNYTPIQVATTVTFTVAIIQMVMYIFRLGIITTLLSETLVNAFTCASAFHVVASQLKDLLGLTLTRRKGVFGLVKTLYDVGSSISQANVAAIVISAIFIIVMVINNEVIKPILSKKTKIPVPIELVAVVTGTGISYGMSLKSQYGVNIVGYVPTGLPNPDLPIFSLIPSVIVDSFVITMVSYTISMSMALIVAQKDHYEVDSNQELLALSFSNCFGSFFSCMPLTASLSRTMIQQAVGGVTQIASVVSCFILLFVLLWIGPLFESLPRCVLASIIVVALKSMILQFMSLKNYWKLSKWDALVWIVTFFTTTLVSIDYGLLAGIIVSLSSIFIQGQKCYTCLLGVVPSTDLYLDIQRYKGIQELPGIKIFHYSGSLNFASKSAFKSQLFKKTGFDPNVLYTKRIDDMELNQYSTSTEEEELVSQCIILDFTALTYIDPSGVETLRSLLTSYLRIDVTMYVCGCSGPVFETFKRCERYQDKDVKFMIFPTVHDAVLYSQSLVEMKKKS
ncbi:hypothetical protein FQR65_LT16240 [Abscondita terminalis]|nr:hypothetical protein FQR65_LT16240 [Abscondita terminalis]